MFSCEKIIVFDLEATCWEGRENAYKWREVISLGACILDLNTLEISEKLTTKVDFIFKKIDLIS